MADVSANTVLGIKVEDTPGTFNAPSSSTDLIAVADLRPSIQGLTSEVNEFTGSIHRPGPIVGGASFEVSGRALLRGPGGSAPPSAGDFILGRILRAVGFAETVQAAAIPASEPEVLGSSGNTTAIAALGASAATTDALYTGRAVLIDALGALPAGLTMIRNYVGTGKLAHLAQIAGEAFDDADKYQIPAQLAYILSPAQPPTLSVSCWIGSKRYDGVGLSVSSFRINLPTFTREQTELPSIEFTLTGDLHADADENAPQPPTGRAVPPYKDGKLYISNTQLGGSSLSIDFGASVAYAPDPNKPTGNESAQLVETTRRVELTLNHVTKAKFDFLAKANAQEYHAVMAMWGLSGQGNHMGLIVPEARFNFASPDNSGPLATMQGEMFIDRAAAAVALTFPYFTLPS